VAVGLGRVLQQGEVVVGRHLIKSSGVARRGGALLERVDERVGCPDQQRGEADISPGSHSGEKAQ